MGQCTEKQADLLRKHRWYNDGLTYEQASKRIDAIKNNGWKKPTSGTAPSGGGTATKTRPPARGQQSESESGDEPTERQVALLVKFGYEPSEYTKKTASALIDELRDNNWQRPDDVDADDAGDDLGDIDF
jgi:hypothetical protein